MAERTNPKRKQSRGLTPWHEAVRSGDIDQVRAQLETGTDINALDERGQTALMNAVWWGNPDIAKLLIERGAKLDHAGKYCLTALFLAVIVNRPQLVRLLINAGADREIKGTGQFNCLPLEYAQHQGMSEIVSIFQKAT